MTFRMKILNVNIQHPVLDQVLDHIASLVDVDFFYHPTAPHISVQFNAQPKQFSWDGMTTTYGQPYTTYAAVQIVPEHSHSWYLIAHEILHTLGLQHREGTLLDTIMQESAFLNAHYTVQQVATVHALPEGDVIDLRGLGYGTPDGILKVSGDVRDNVLFGGQGMADPVDEGEFIFGKGGNDAIYANGGNDTVYGGSGEVDPNDGADRIYAGGGNNLIFGNGGDDQIFARNGQADTIYGGAGMDAIEIDAGLDVVYDNDCFLYV